MSKQREHGIAWTDVTWNPVRGCSRVSEGCRNCYAERVATRFSGPGQPYEGLATVSHRHPQTGAAQTGRRGHWTGKVVLVPERLADPLRWRKPRKVFVNSMSDLFHEALTNEQIAAVFGVMAAAPQHTFQVLTKRAERMRDWFMWLEAFASPADLCVIAAGVALGRSEFKCAVVPWPLPNVWLGVSVEDQQTADERIPDLLATPAAVRWVSYEPGLGHVDFSGPLTQCCRDCLGTGEGEGAPCEECGGSGRHNRIDWIVVGGESGPLARPFEVAWARSTVRQCRAAGVPVFMKQLGANVRDRNDRLATDNPPDDQRDWPEPKEGWHDGNVQHNLDGYRDDYQGAPVRIRLKDAKGGDPSEWPEDLRVREFPRG